MFTTLTHQSHIHSPTICSREDINDDNNAANEFQSDPRTSLIKGCGIIVHSQIAFCNIYKQKEHSMNYLPPRDAF